MTAAGCAAVFDELSVLVDPRRSLVPAYRAEGVARSRTNRPLIGAWIGACAALPHGGISLPRRYHVPVMMLLPTTPDAIRPPAAVGGAARLLRAGEFLLLFGGIPLALVFAARALRLAETPVLAAALPLAAAITAAAACFLWLWADPSFDRRQLGRGGAKRGDNRAMLALFAGAAMGITSAMSIAAPQWLFWLPRHQPMVWLAFLPAYPLISVLPQELIYRSFFFHRYRPLFGDGRAMIVASAVAFGYMHIVFNNPMAVLLTLLGGALFAWRYRHARSLLLATVEHALYGILVFTVGLGPFFSNGTLRLVGG